MFCYPFFGKFKFRSEIPNVSCRCSAKSTIMLSFFQSSASASIDFLAHMNEISDVTFSPDITEAYNERIGLLHLSCKTQILLP